MATRDVPAVQFKPVATALIAILLLGLAVHSTASTKLTLLLVIGTLFGIVLYHALFGFTSAFRILLADGRSAGFRAQLVMLGVACLMFFPALAGGSLFGQPVQGNVSPAGVSVVFGAFIFGIGMQLGGGCASGTLFTAGGGSIRMLVTLLFFIIGSVIGVLHQAWWKALPALEPVSLVTALGWPSALGLNLAVFTMAYVSVAQRERRRHGTVASLSKTGQVSWLRGPWPLLAGAIALALLNFTTLYLSGKPWGITSAFGLWGGKALQAIGLPVATWPGYAVPAMQKSLDSNLLTDVTTVMDFGIILGALLAAGLAGKFLPEWRISRHHLAACVLGGLLLGYGARLAYGCNIGAFFSGIASGSLHGWLWIVCALIGNGAGIYLRPLFRLSVPRS